MKGFYLVVTILALSACTELPAVTKPTPSDYDRALYHARQSVDQGNYWAAERLLDEFVRTHPDSREAREVAFWKAAYMVDPANDRGSLSGGITALDQYLATDSAGMYINEARVLRRTAAAALSAAPRPVVTTTPPATTGTKDTVVVVTRSREEEIAALKDQLAKSKEELAKVSAELDRIKKRLANPSN